MLHGGVEVIGISANEGEPDLRTVGRMERQMRALLALRRGAPQ